jgi:hypothetical protein
MRLKRRDRHEADRLNCQIHVDPAGDRAPWVTLEDGTEVGSIGSILEEFEVEDLSKDEAEVLQQWHRIRDVSEHARAIERLHHKAEHSVFEFLSKCEQFFKHAAENGFRVPSVPPIPGIVADRSIKVDRWNLAEPESRSTILRTLLIGIDWRRKALEWNYDPVRIDVLSGSGEKLTTVTLREGYQGPIA